MRGENDHPHAAVEFAVRPAALDDVVALAGLAVRFRSMLAALSRPELAAAPRIFLRVSEHNRRAVALYTRLGFHPATADHFTTGATPGGDLVLVLDRPAHAR